MPNPVHFASPITISPGIEDADGLEDVQGRLMSQTGTS